MRRAGTVFRAEQARRHHCGTAAPPFNPKKGERPWPRMILDPWFEGKRFAFYCFDAAVGWQTRPRPLRGGNGGLHLSGGFLSSGRPQLASQACTSPSGMPCPASMDRRASTVSCHRDPSSRSSCERTPTMIILPPEVIPAIARSLNASRGPPLLRKLQPQLRPHLPRDAVPGGGEERRLLRYFQGRL